jgi:hypothetical protein
MTIRDADKAENDVIKDKIFLTFLLKMCLMKGVTGSWIKPKSMSRQDCCTHRGLKHRRYNNDKEIGIKL